ncbi:hypothetical protein [Clostridium sp. LIBA-8841]|uniref:hypothetical protein n=1 Tax=Clostridium sp. LIBA-8841 TaxID=2987530 RepID=UPI002AC5BA95|nr:hypothetical protein [Clostridium sp. LIBA-8841]MDZ5253692.1 hypothetical protein [Clostridium sp. LIBA-8841]
MCDLAKKFQGEKKLEILEKQTIEYIKERLVSLIGVSKIQKIEANELFKDTLHNSDAFEDRGEIEEVDEELPLAYKKENLIELLKNLNDTTDYKESINLVKPLFEGIGNNSIDYLGINKLKSSLTNELKDCCDKDALVNEWIKYLCE